VATICTALQALFVAEAIPNLTTADSVTQIDWLADNSGELFDMKTRTGGLDIIDDTTDPGISTDLAAIEAADSDWYGLLLDSNSKAEIAAAAVWAEAGIKMFGSNTADSEVLAATAGNIMETLNAAAYARTYCIYSADLLSFAAAGWMAGNIWDDPGARTWKFKTINGVTYDRLSSTARANIVAVKGNWYSRIAGRNVTQEGWTVDGEFIDIQLTIDALQARIQEAVAVLLFNQPKVPYTDDGVNIVVSAILGVLQAFQGTGALDPLTAVTVTAPKVADVDPLDRAARLLPDIDFTGRLAGAIHKVEIRGKLTI
jgi:hypothetical protein